MLLVKWKTIQVDRQGLLNVTTVKVNDIWLGNALGLSDQGLQHDPGVLDGQAVQKIIPNNVAFKNEDLDTYNSDCDDISNAKMVLMAIISNYGQSAQIVHMLTKPQAFYENIHKQDVGYQNPFHLKKAQWIKPTLYDGIFISSKHVVMHVIDDEETLILKEESRLTIRKRFTPRQELSAEQAFWLHMSDPTSKPSDSLPVKIEAPKEIPKISLVNESLKKLKFHLAKFNNVAKITTTPNARTEGEWGFEHTKAVFNNEIIPFQKSLKDIFNVFDRDLLNEIIEDIIKSLRENSKEENVNYDYGEIETKNMEVKNSVAKLSSENKRLDNKNNDRISQTPSRNIKNKVEAQPRNANKTNRIVEPIQNVDVKHSQLNENSEPICDTFRFGNDHIARIMGYGDYQLGNVTILRNPPYKYTWADKVVPVTEGNSETTTERYMENNKNVSQDIRDQLNAKAEAEFGKFTSRDGESLESYYSRFNKMMNELVRNQCDVTNHQVNVQFLLQLQPEWQRFVTLIKQSQELKTVSYHKLYDILKQHQNEVNEIRAERLARIANPLALVAQQQPVYHPQNHPTHYTQNSSTRSQQAATKNKGKEIVNSSPPIYDQEPAMVAEDDEMETVGTPVVQKSRIQCYNCKEYGHVAREWQADWRDDSDDEPEDQELEAHYIYMAQIQEVTPDAADNSGPIFDSEPLQKDDDDDLANECDLLASLIEKLKCEIDDSKNRNKFLETSNKVLVDKLKGEIKDFKTKNKSLESSNNHFKEANNELSKTNQLMYKDLKKFQAELDRYNDVKYASKIKFYKTREDKEIDKVIALENKVKVLDNIVYKTGQIVQTTNMLNRNCKTSFAKPESLKKAQRANPRLYDADCYNDNLALMLAPKSDEEMVADLRYFNSLELEVDSLKSQLETQKTQFLNEKHDIEQINHDDDDDDLANERDLLASLIEKLKCEIDDSKNRNKFLETSNKVLVDKLKGQIEDFKTKNKSLESSNNHFKEANNELSKTNELMYKDLKKFQDRYNDVKYASKLEIDCAKAKGELMSYKMEFKKSFNAYTRQINDLNQMISKIKKELFAHQETISILSQAKEAQLKFYKTREDKEIDKVIVLENKFKDFDNIVYKTDQSVQTMNMLNRHCKTSFAKPEFLKKAQRANPRLYDIGCYNDNRALMLSLESDEVIRLEKESRSKLSDLIRPFDYEKLNNLYDLFVPQCEKSSTQRYFSERSKMSHTPVNNEKSKESFNRQTTLLEKRMDESIPWDQKCKSSKENFKIKKSVGTIIDGVERCKQTITKRTYFGHIDPFIQNTIEENFCPVIRRIDADLEKFHLCLKEEMVADLRYFNSLEPEVDSLKSQLETQKT
nr:hypothetical protein [Tanacetum cinerariifolium]